MTLQDAYDIHVAKMHARTIRRYLGWRVVNAANSNCRAGAFPSPVPATAKGEGVIPTLSPTLSLDTHSLLHIAGAE